MFIGITSPETSWISLCGISFKATCEGGNARAHDPPQFLPVADLQIRERNLNGISRDRVDIYAVRKA